MRYRHDALYASRRSPVFARNLVATSQPLATQAGLLTLERGGNALDAALAAAITLTVVEPTGNGIGSDAFCILWHEGQLHGLNASGRSPAGWTPERYSRHTSFPHRGWDTVTVPGAVSAWAELSQRFGRLPFERLFEPAIGYAEAGFLVSPVIAELWKRGAAELKSQPGFAATFMPDGHVPAAGELFRSPGHARTLRLIAETRGEAFYRGELAQRIGDFARQHGAALDESDLAEHTTDWCGTIQQDFEGVNLHEIPPNGQGIAALMTLGILQEAGIEGLQVDSADALHLQIEAMKLAFADVYRWVGDHRHMTAVKAEHLLDDAYLASRAKLIDPRRAVDFDHGTPPGGGTVYLTAADGDGMMVSLIQSNYMGFGSGIVVPGTGISLQNRGYGFTVDANHPNVVAGGKRPFHTIIPGFLTTVVDGVRRPQMSFGVMGGNMQPQGHLQTLVRMLVHGQQPQAACDAPRWKVGAGLAVDFEPTMDPSLVEGLKAMGHRFEATDDAYMDYGSGQFIWKLSDDLDDGYVAASDSRRDGQAVGF